MSLRPTPVPSGGLAAYRFEGFTLDLGKSSLFWGAEEVKLRPKPFEALRCLVEHSGCVVSKDKLTGVVWPDSFVSDNSLAQCLLEIRKALHDDDQRIIKTVPRRGYLFNVPVERVLSLPAYPGPVPVVSLAPAPASTPDSGSGVPPAPGPESGNGRPMPAPLPARLSPGRFRWLAGGAGVLVVLIAASLWRIALRPAPSDTPSTIAVLPFQSLVPSQPDEFLELGMADVLITRLSNLRQLAVRPTSAVREYTHRQRDPVEIGKRLKVAYVVEGSVQQNADRIRVTIQLIGVRDGRPLWAERYDEPSGDIFAVQDAISTRVASSLALKISGAEAGRLLKKPTSDTEAFQLYLRGRYFWDQRTKEGLNKALGYFDGAVRRDPRFALAYAAAAQCYAPLVWLGFSRSDDATLSEMRRLVDRAVELDPDMADAFVAMGSLRLLEWDWPGAESAFQRAIALNPSHPLAHTWYGFLLEAMGREEENLAERKRALELDPLNWNANAAVGSALGAMGRHDEAIQVLRLAAELNPGYFFTRRNLGIQYLAAGKPGLAIAEFQAARDLPSLAYTYAVNGQKAEARRVLTQMRQDSETNAFDMAVVNVGLERMSEALDGLEQAYRDRIFSLIFLRVDERLASLRGGPRFESIAAAMKIPPARR